MKKILFFLLGSLFLLKISPAIAYQYSELHIRLQDNSQFTVLLDDISYPVPVSYFSIHKISPGYHQLTILGAIQQPTNPPHILYSGSIFLPELSRIFAYIDPYRKVNFTTSSPINFQDNLYCPYTHLYPSLPGSQYRPESFTEESFDKFKAYLTGITTFKRLQLMKESIFFSNISSSQVAELMLLLDFEPERLELAKFAFSFTTDKSNYFLTYDSFIFSGTREELRKTCLGAFR